MALRYLLQGQMKFMKQNGFAVLMISDNGKELNELIQTEECEHIIVPMTRKITPLQDLKCLYQLIKIFKKQKPDIVHSHTPKAGLLGMLAAYLAGVKIRIHTVGGIPFTTKSGFTFHLLKFLEKITYWCATQVWPNSHSLQQYIIQQKLTPQKKIKIILKGSSNGIDINRFNKASLNNKIVEVVQTKINYNKENFYLLFIGRLVFDKGIVELINVFLRLCKTYPHLKLLLAGRYENDLDPLPKETIKEISDNSSIIFIDWTEIGEYYMLLANCFIFPSHREGFPNVLLQAGAMQLPVICSNIYGNVDIIENEKTGLLFEKGNETEIYNSIKFAIENKDKMQQMAMVLYENINTNYKRENVWQSILYEYNSLLKS